MLYGPSIHGECMDIAHDLILTASYRPDDSVQLWDFGTGKLVDTVSWHGDDNNRSLSMCLTASFNKHSNKDFFACGGSGNNELRFFDFENDNLPFASIIENDQPIFSMDFSADNDRFCMAK